nr:peptidoglycan-binding domain-containing protein [Streptomyces coryli]
MPVITPSAGDSSSSPATKPAKTREPATPPADRSSPRRNASEARTPTASPSRDDSAYLEPGEEGAQVAYLQQDLADLGFYGKDGLDAGGQYGPLTAAAVTSLRNNYGVMDDGGEGVAGPKTLAKIRELTGRG